MAENGSAAGGANHRFRQGGYGLRSGLKGPCLPLEVCAVAETRAIAGRSL